MSLAWRLHFTQALHLSRPGSLFGQLLTKYSLPSRKRLFKPLLPTEVIKSRMLTFLYSKSRSGMRMLHRLQSLSERR